MYDVFYFVIGPGPNRKYGVAAIDQTGKHSAAAAPFLRERREAEQLASRLNDRQLPISEFCEAFVTGRVAEIT